jgi:hypothetical protein
MPRAYSTSCRSKTSLASMQNEIDLNPAIGYLPSSQSYTCMSISLSSNLKKVDLFGVMCLEAPLWTYHPTPQTMLVERHNNGKGSIKPSSKLVHSWSFSTSSKLFMLLLYTLPLLLKTLRSIMAMLVATEALDMAQILLLLGKRRWSFFLLLTFLWSFLSSLTFPMRARFGTSHGLSHWQRHPTGFGTKVDSHEHVFTIHNDAKMDQSHSHWSILTHSFIPCHQLQLVDFSTLWSSYS